MKYNGIVFGIIMVLLLMFILYRRQKVSDEDNQILLKPSYAIGVIDEDKTTGNYKHRPERNRRTLKFHFQAKGKKIVINYGLYKKKPENILRVGSKYLVAYLEDDPEKCLLLYDKPIKDSIDFFKHVNSLTNEKE